MPKTLALFILILLSACSNSSIDMNSKAGTDSPVNLTKSLRDRIQGSWQTDCQHYIDATTSITSYTFSDSRYFASTVSFESGDCNGSANSENVDTDEHFYVLETTELNLGIITFPDKAAAKISWSKTENSEEMTIQFDDTFPLGLHR